MALKQDIDNLIIQATKARSPELEIYKLIKCEFVNAEKSGTTINQETENKILLKMAAQRKDSIAQYEAGGRADLAAAERAELEVLEQFIPKGPTTEEVRDALTEAIEEYLADKPDYVLSKRDMKALMTVVRNKLPLAQGGEIATLFNQVLAAQ
jgi:hypothetical protein